MIWIYCQEAGPCIVRTDACWLLASCFRNDFSLVSGPGFSRLALLSYTLAGPASNTLLAPRSLLRLGAAAEKLVTSVPRPSQARASDRTKTRSLVTPMMVCWPSHIFVNMVLHGWTSDLLEIEKMGNIESILIYDHEWKTRAGTNKSISSLWA